MRINVHELRNAPLEVEVDESPRDFQLTAEGFTFPGRLTGQLRFQMVGKRILTNGFIGTTIGAACVRCLSPMEQRIRTNVELVFEPRPTLDQEESERLRLLWGAEEQEIEFYDEDFLDPTESLRQLLLLDLPGNPLCRKECRGLCPQCGVDLNREACHCPRSDEWGKTGETDWKARLKNLDLQEK